MNAYPAEFEIVFRKRDEALRGQDEMARTDLSKLIEDCERLRVLQEVFANTVEEPPVVYTRS